MTTNTTPADGLDAIDLGECSPLCRTGSIAALYAAELCARARRPAIPAEDRLAITAVLRRRGVAVTEDRIQALYNTVEDP